jgi:hypothetical protein
LDLEPVDALRGTAPRAVQVPARTTLVTLVLATTGPPAASYELEIRDARDHVTWQGGNLTPGPAGALTLVLPKGLLPLGDVRLRLYAIGPEGRRLAHEYAVRIGEVP